MRVLTKVSFSELTTFHVGGPAKYLIKVSDLKQLREALLFARDKKLPVLILGGGSNVLVSDKGFDGVVIYPRFFGFEISGEKVRIAASENWDDCVRRIVEASLWGAENLSFVPGSAAGLAIQNVGAYGQEAKTVIDFVEVYDQMTNEELRITNEKCGFGYRRSIFNTTEKGRYVILGLTLKLSKNGEPNTGYGVKADTLSGMRKAIIAVRKSKGQDPDEFWSAGSFFKNVIVSEEQYKTLPVGTPCYPVDEPSPTPPSIEGGAQRGFVKIPAGFLLDKICNLKGLSVGGAKLSEKQVINIINTGNATAQDVLALFRKARQICYDQTGIVLENEPELIGFSDAELRQLRKCC